MAKVASATSVSREELLDLRPSFLNPQGEPLNPSQVGGYCGSGSVARSGVLRLGDQLDEVAACVVEDRHDSRAGVGWRLGEGDPQADEAVMLGRAVVDGELDQRDPVVSEGLAVGGDGGVAGGLQQELRTIRVACANAGR